MSKERTSSQAPFLRLPWTSGRISGRAAKSGILLLTFLLAWIFLISDAGILSQLHQRSVKAALEEEVSALISKELQLEEEAQRLATDPEYRERIAREEWGFKRPGERVYHIQRDDS
ncbi:MAG: septum formation initiator family protein [bacterium]|nr:septum formation initiator family protein [bacterium]